MRRERVLKECKGAKNYDCPKKLKNVKKKTENLKLKLRVIMLDKAWLPWKQGKITFCVCFLFSFSQLTYTVSKQLASLYFDYFSCYQQIKFPPHLLVTRVQGENLVSNPPVGKLISSLWFGNMYILQIIYSEIFDCLLIVQLVSKHLSCNEELRL